MPNYVGARLAVAAAVPATRNKAGYEALSWVEVAGLQVGPRPGFDTAIVEKPDLTSGYVESEKGMSTGAESEMAFHRVAGDVGQANLETYAAPTYGANISLRLILPSGGNNHVYSSGILRSFMSKEVDGENEDGFTVNFNQNGPHLRTTAP